MYSLLIRQIGLFFFIGILITFFGQILYFVFIKILYINPLLSISYAYIIGMIIGYILHTIVTFHKKYEKFQINLQTYFRFFIVNIISYSLSLFFVWLFVSKFGWNIKTPIIPNALFVPVITFFLHRQWTYR